MNITSPIEYTASQVVFADHLFHQELLAASTVGQLQDRTSTLIATWGGIDGIHDRLVEVQTSLSTVTEGNHQSIVLTDDLGAGVLGTHHFDSRTSRMRRDQFSAQQLVDHSAHTRDTVLHENGTLGHAGQDPAVFDRLEIIVNGARIPFETVLEGNVVANVSRELGQTREGLPEETYLEGYRIVTELGVDEVDAYLRVDGAHNSEHLQTLVWAQNEALTPEQMFEEGEALNMDPAVVARELRSRFLSTVQPTTQSA